MNDIQKIKEFFSKPLNEVSGNVDIEDFNKVVQAIQQTNYPVTVMLTSMFGNEIEIIVGMDAPDPLIDAISDIMDDLGYNSNRDYSIAGDSSTLSRRQYDEIRKINGGHKDYYRESVSKEKNKSLNKSKDVNELSFEFGGITVPEAKKTDLVKKIKEAITTAYETMDINDPVLMKARAAAFQRTQPKPEPVKTTNPNYKAIKNADKIKALKMRRAQLMRDMEQEAEPEGGPIADRYGDMLNKIDKAIAMLSEGNKEYFKPSIRKDKSNPNFLFVDIAYPEGSGVLSVGGSKTMSGQDREEGAAKALAMGNEIVKKLEAKYNIEDIEIKDLKNGKVQVFAVSDDFIKMASPSLDEAKTAVDMAKKQLDALGVKYELGNEFKPFKVIYKPTGQSDEFYDTFEDIVDLFSLKGVVKSSMGEAKFMSGMLSGKDFINAKLSKYPKAKAKVNQLIDMIGESKFTIEMAEWIFDFFNNAHFESPVYEASKKEETEFHKKLDKLVHSTFGKRKDELEETVNLKASKLSSAEYQKAKKLKDFKSSDWKWNADEDLYTKVNEAELTEAYVPSNIKEFAKRKGVSSLVNKVAGWAEKVGAGIRGGTAIGYNYSTLILDMTYQGSEIRINTDNDTVTLYDEPVNSFNEFQRVYIDGQDLEENVAPNHNGKSAPYGSGYKPLEEKIAEALNKINEELCPAGKAYIKRRKAAGEKSSAYLSGRAVKVCKGQMSGKAKKKK